MACITHSLFSSFFSFSYFFFSSFYASGYKKEKNYTTLSNYYIRSIQQVVYSFFKLTMTEATTENVSVMPITISKPPVVRFNINRQCPIQYVTVYNDRAEVTRILRHHFDVEGTYELVLDGFSTFVDQTSLHVSGGTGKSCTILEVSYQTQNEDVAPPSDLSPLDQLQQELLNVRTEMETHKREIARISKQRAWLDGRSSKLMNQDGPCTSNDLENMQQFLEFYHKTLLKLDDETVHEESELKVLSNREEALKAQIEQHGAVAQANRRKTSREMTILVHVASDKIDVALEISYLIGNCSWSASYDVRVSTVDASRQRTQLTYYGIIVSIQMFEILLYICIQS